MYLLFSKLIVSAMAYSVNNFRIYMQVQNYTRLTYSEDNGSGLDVVVVSAVSTWNREQMFFAINAVDIRRHSIV